MDKTGVSYVGDIRICKYVFASGVCHSMLDGGEVMTLKEEYLARKLFEIGAVQFGDFPLRDGSRSPIYFNYRTPEHPTKPGPLNQQLLTIIGHCFYGIACRQSLVYEYVAGIPQAGEPLAEAFSRDPSFRLPISLLRFWEEGGRIKGVKENVPPSTILLIDDVITRAGAKREAIEAAQNAGHTVRDVLVVTDREQGGKEELANIGVCVHAIFSLTNLLTYYVQAKKIVEEKRKEVMDYLSGS